MKQIYATQFFLKASLPSGAIFIVQTLWVMLPCFLSAQAPPNLVWQRALGGNKDDVARSVQQTPDGGFIVAGNTRSNNGDVGSNAGGSDAWVIKLDGSGNLEWEKTFGGSGDEIAHSIQLTADGGYGLAGIKSGNAWVLKLDGDGSQVWEKTFGGNNHDAFNSITPTADGGFVAVGVKDVHILNGLKGDCWIVKLDADGNFEWEKIYGDELQDAAYSIQQTSDGGYVVAGIRDYNIYLGGSSGGGFWIFRLEGDGNLLWEKVFGGSLIDRAYSVIQTSSGGYIAAGTANIYGGDVNVGGFPNPLIVKLSADGSTDWVEYLTEDIFNGNVYSVCETPSGGFMIAGGGGLPDEGDPETGGDERLIPNLMLIELDAGGKLLSTNSFGSSKTDEGHWISPTTDSGFVVAGYTRSNNGDVSSNRGGSDVWVVKLSKSPGVHYVDKDATGANNGTSWADAYTDLQDALAAAQPGDHIWVAEGTYLPGTSASSTFLIEKDIKLYGGFTGTETNLLQRDWATYPTILSGDVNGNDVVDNFTTNRSDNVNNILHLTSDVTNALILDGFIVQGGHADNISSSAPEALRGGGMWSAGSPTMRNCTFRQNYASELGAGAYFGELTSGLVVQDCMFEANKVKDSPNGFGGAMFVLNSTAFQKIERCVFLHNFTGSLALFTDSGEISECQFINNENRGYGAGLLASVQSDSGFILVKDCQFTGNISGQVGAGIFGECVTSNNQLKVMDCTFEENIADGVGGGMFVIAVSDNHNIEIDNCIFKGNQADEGGGLMIQASNPPGQPVPVATNLNVTIEGCIFEENQAPDFKPNIFSGGGGIFVLNIPGSINTRVSIESSQFIRNTSDNLGGGLTIYDETGNASYSVSNSLFSENAALNAGGITFINTGQEMSKLDVRSSILEGNRGAMTGGLSVQNDRQANSPKDSIFIENSLIAENLGGTIAGGISIQAEAEVFIFESTIANNENTGLKLQNNGKAHLRNTILHNPGHDNFSSTGIIHAISSLGGNLSGDQTFSTFFGAADKTNTDPLFIGSGTYPYQLSSSSPAIDAAVPVSNVPSLDLAGNARVQGTKMDMGAYESPFFTALKDRAATQQDLVVWPNPMSEKCVVKLENEWRGIVEIKMVDERGLTVRNWKAEKTASLLEVKIEANGLATGDYYVVLTNGLEMSTCKLIRI